jgi:hypothetical protein
MDSQVEKIQSMVQARGLRLSSVNPIEDVLLPPSGKVRDLEIYGEILDHYAARLLLKEIINARAPDEWTKGRDKVERFCDASAVDDFLERFKELGVISSTSDIPRTVKTVRSFGPTYEWYTAQVLNAVFNAPAAWGVIFQGLGSGGDYDVLSSLSGRFLYMEVKTSPPGRIESPEIDGFVKRLLDIAPDIAIFNNDTHLRMKDKIIPMLESSISEAHGKRGERVHFKHLVREIFHFRGVVYVINSKPDLKRNLEAVFKHYFRTKSGVLREIP